MLQTFPRVAKCVRAYSSKPTLGPKFQSLDEIKEYIFKDTISANEFLTQSERAKDRELPVPPRETVLKLLKLSGLPTKGADIERIQRNLSEQISFINILHDTDLDDSLNVKYARLLPRENATLSYEDLIVRANSGKNSELAEISGSWDSTSRASMRKDGYFIVREEFLDNRD
ncbi:hypothetical protein ZYGR_0I05410 [Zygosaccharomyces rouxii]|uniref:Glutamyl-tRNA(Gln) amidotransferase subunit F, mitochondrial n=1 Tax=Zygosaccharomyces rouxii TaxID=4956 RepID=A0A1Q2ZXY2_ZYGRO|nr:hypothetical protein ZYGR_0I05410 [Zygosaccharomyces rouxii]